MIHGGDVYSEGLLKGRELLDFSSNINPLGVPKCFKDNLVEALEAVERYPDIKYRELLKNLSCYTGVEEKNFVLGNGAAEIINLVISCFKRILIVVPSFVEYELNALKWGCEIQYSYLDENMNLDYGDVFEKLDEVEAVIIGNPNNPNGSIIDKTKFEPILKYCHARDKTIILDEAFIEFAGIESYSFIDKLKSYNCLFIIRALTKFFALPGVRFGYGISTNEELLNKIRAKQDPWNINCFAELAVEYVLKDYDYIERSKIWLREEIPYYTEQLRKIEFVDKVYGTYSNYVLCKLKGISDERLYDLCLEKGIVIRKAGNYKGLNHSFIRLAIKDREKNNILLESLKAIEQDLGIK